MSERIWKPQDLLLLNNIKIFFSTLSPFRQQSSIAVGFRSVIVHWNPGRRFTAPSSSFQQERRILCLFWRILAASKVFHSFWSRYRQQVQSWELRQSQDLLLVRETAFPFVCFIWHIGTGFRVSGFSWICNRKTIHYLDLSQLKITAISSNVNVWFFYLHSGKSLKTFVTVFLAFYYSYYCYMPLFLEIGWYGAMRNITDVHYTF